MAANSALKYELLLPQSFLKLHQFKQSDKKSLIECSIDLFNFKSITIDRYNGIISLNKSLDREECDSYKFLIKVTDLVENHRLSSILTLKLNVKDLNDNRVQFEQKHYMFHIMENTIINTSIIPIRLIDPDLNTAQKNLIFKLLPLNDEDYRENFNLINSHFALNTEQLAENKIISLLVRKPLDYTERKLFLIKLIVSEGGEEYNTSEMTLIEVNVLSSSSQNFHSKFDMKITSNLSQLYCNLTKLENELFLVETNLDLIANKLPRTHNLDFLRIHSTELDDLKLRIVKVNFYDYLKQKRALQELNGESGGDDGNLSSNFYSLKSSTLNINNFNTYLMLNRIKNKPKYLVSVLNIELSSLSMNHSSNLTLIIVFYDRFTQEDKFKIMDLKYFLVEKLIPKLNAEIRNSSAYFINNYYKKIGLNSGGISNHNNFYEDFSYADKAAARKKGFIKSIRAFLSAKNNQLPIIVVCLGLLMLMLFIVLFLYSVLKLVKSKSHKNDYALDNSGHLNVLDSTKIKNSKYLDQSVNLLINTNAADYALKQHSSSSSVETNSNVSSNSTNTTTNTAGNDQQQFRFNKLTKYLACDHQPNHIDEFSIQNNQQKKNYLIDSPIMARKFIESADLMTMTDHQNNNYVKKYNLEYLFDAQTNNNRTNLMNCSQHNQIPNSSTSNTLKSKKKIKFQFNEEQQQQQQHQSPEKSSNELFIEDDDFILPLRVNSTNHRTNSMNRNPMMNRYPNSGQLLPHYHDPHPVVVSSMKNSNSSNNTYKKSPIQPEDNVWIKKYSAANSNSYGNMYNLQNDRGEIIL